MNYSYAEIPDDHENIDFPYLFIQRRFVEYMDGTKRATIKPGIQVDIVLKADQRTGKLTRGIVKDILTNSPNHPHGIKVRLTDGQIGRIQAIIEKE